MPIVTTKLDNGTSFGIINSITTGFGNTLGNIGIIIGFGVMMGQIFERTGAAKRMAVTFLRIFGRNREEEALALTGFLVSIPIFCDSGFIILAPIAKAISKATKKSVISLGAALAAPCDTHSLVLDTPESGLRSRYFQRGCRPSFILSALPLPTETIACTFLPAWVGNKIYQITNDEVLWIYAAIRSRTI